MKFLLLVILTLPSTAFCEDKEGDLLLPVTDISQVEKQEEVPPSLEEVEMQQKKTKKARKIKKSDQKKTKDKK
jgi:hypothetical protein